jgi:very-short-patch-repair endonuclease
VRQHGIVTRAQLKGLGLSRAAIDKAVTRSRPERSLLELIRAGGLPQPEVNVALGPYIVDFLWRAERLVVEVDSYQFHGPRRSFEADHARDLDLESDDFEVMRFTRDQIVKQPEWVLVQLAQRLDQLRRSSGSVA